MYLFLLLAFPAFILGWFLSITKEERISYAPLLIWGVIAAGVVYIAKSFFIFTSHLWTTSFMNGFFFLFLTEAFIPCVVVYGIFLIFSKDSPSYRASAFIPLMAAFYAIYIPFRVLKMTEADSLYTLFVKPVMYICMVAYVSTFLKKIFTAGQEKSPLRVISNSLLVIVSMALPAVIETYWYLGGTIFIYLPLALVYSVMGFMLYLKLRGTKTVAKQKTEKLFSA